MVSLHEVTIGSMLNGLKSLQGLLVKAQATEGLDLAGLPSVRLTEDMLPFAFQIQTACNVAHKSIPRLRRGQEGKPVVFPDDEKTVDELVSRLAKTIELLEAYGSDDVKSETEEIELTLGTKKTTLSTKDYALHFALPNFYFHVQTAYCILRMKGVDIGKRDYLVPFMKDHAIVDA